MRRIVHAVCKLEEAMGGFDDGDYENDYITNDDTTIHLRTSMRCGVIDTPPQEDHWANFLRQLCDGLITEKYGNPGRRD